MAVVAQESSINESQNSAASCLEPKRISSVRLLHNAIIFSKGHLMKKLSLVLAALATLAVANAANAEDKPMMKSGMHHGMMHHSMRMPMHHHHHHMMRHMMKKDGM